MKQARPAVGTVPHGGVARTTSAARSPAPAAHRYYRRKTCRVCKSPRLKVFLDFGSMPLANAFRPESESATAADQRYPLSCAYCAECGLVQLPVVVDRTLLFKRYSYFSSASVPMVEHFRQQAELIRKEYLTEPSCLICEIGSNDGTFLQNLVGTCRVIGVDPADNVAADAALKGVATVGVFFNPQTASRLRNFFAPAKVIFTANCFAHVDDLDSFMEAVVTLLRDDGVFIIENHRFVHLLRSVCFDQIYHEHLCYYTLRPIERLLERFGMRVIDARLIPTQGESFQIHCAKRNSAYEEHPRVARLRDEENGLGLDRVETYEHLAQAVRQRLTDLRSLLDDLKSSGKRIVGYGAPGKASVLLNVMGVDRDTIDYAIDSTPLKQGCVIPGTGIPTEPPQTLQSDAPDHVQPLAWNYADVILQRESGLRARGIKFILPIPSLRIV